MSDRIEKSIELKAPVARVWRALTDHNEFGTWFRVKLDDPFLPGQLTRGRITYPGYEHLRFEVLVKTMEPERSFSFTCHPYAVDPDRIIHKRHPPWSNSPWSRRRTAHCSAWSNRASTRFRKAGAPRRSA